jgi:hypothetical protein
MSNRPGRLDQEARQDLAAFVSELRGKGGALEDARDDVRSEFEAIAPANVPKFPANVPSLRLRHRHCGVTSNADR